MAIQGPILIIEDDEDDQEFMSMIMQRLHVKNKLLFYGNAVEALPYLKSAEESPFLILCDVNLPLKTGIEFKQEIDQDPQLRKKNIPFIFYSTSDDQPTVNDAYTKISVQGFFKKPSNLEDVKAQMKIILDYWTYCLHPNT